MKESTIQARVDLAIYFWAQGYQVIPLNPEKKQPYYKGWTKWRTNDPSRIEKAMRLGWGLGLKPNYNDFCYIDVDNDHHDKENGSSELAKIIPEIHTVSQTKIGGTNKHYFFKVPAGKHSWRFTGNQQVAEGVEISNRDSQVRIFPNYRFDNLDLNRKFIDQLQELPANLTAVLDAMTPKPQPKVHHHYKKGNALKYLSKVPVPEIGGRQSEYRRLCYHMVKHLGMDYDDVAEALVQWDRENINYQAQEPAQFHNAIRNPK